MILVSRFDRCQLIITSSGCPVSKMYAVNQGLHASVDLLARVWPPCIGFYGYLAPLGGPYDAVRAPPLFRHCKKGLKMGILILHESATHVNLT